MPATRDAAIRVFGALSIARRHHSSFTLQQIQVFLIIASRDGIAHGDIVRLTGAPSSSITRAAQILDHVGRRGVEPLRLIEIVPSNGNGRGPWYRLTPKGRRLAEDMAEAIHQDVVDDEIFGFGLP